MYYFVGVKKAYTTLQRGDNDKMSLSLVKGIWVYDLINLSLVDKAPFKSKVECGKALGINRSTVSAHLDKNKWYKNKWIFSSNPLSKDKLSQLIVPSRVWEIVTGELLGDGYICYHPLKTPKVNGRLEFTFSSKILHYVKYLKYEALAYICTESDPTPWPNPKGGLEPLQYWFSSKRLVSITQLHSIWYTTIEGKTVKTLPIYIKNMLTPLGLAHWIMRDGYYSDGCTKICTDNFTKQEVSILIDILEEKFGIKSTLRKRSSLIYSIVWRISISRYSMEKFILLVRPHMIPEMLYKLGLENTQQQEK